jgi:hypothetical protein
MAMIDGMPGFNMPAPAAAAKIQVDKAPVWGAATAPAGLAGNSPWTAAQRAAGGRYEIPVAIPGVPQGIGTNWMAPPVQPRQQLANMIGDNWMSAMNGGVPNRVRGGGSDSVGAGAGGHGYGWGGQGNLSGAGFGYGSGYGYGGAGYGGHSGISGDRGNGWGGY